MNTRTNRPLAIAFCLALIAFGAFFRVFRLDNFAALQNFAPLMAIACCGALFLPGRLALAAPLGALIISDVLLDIFRYGAAPFAPEELIRYACYGLAVASGLAIRRLHGSTLAVLGTVTANSIVFYVVTNSVSWFTNPNYVKTAAGWLQSLTVGLPGYPPTLLFLRNSLVSDLLFTGVFLVAMRLAAREPRAIPAHA